MLKPSCAGPREPARERQRRAVKLQVSRTLQCYLGSQDHQGRSLSHTYRLNQTGSPQDAIRCLASWTIHSIYLVARLTLTMADIRPYFHPTFALTSTGLLIQLITARSTFRNGTILRVQTMYGHLDAILAKRPGLYKRVVKVGVSLCRGCSFAEKMRQSHGDRTK